MFGHIFLDLNFRSEREPLIKGGFAFKPSHAAMGAAGFRDLIVATSTLPIQIALQITNLRLGDCHLVIAVSFAATFWMELEKILKKST